MEAPTAGDERREDHQDEHLSGEDTPASGIIGSCPPPVLWSPPPDARSSTRIGAYLAWLERSRGLAFDDYAALHRWSVNELGAFWSSVWEHFGVRSSTDPGPALADRHMPGATWFPGARLNWAEHCLRLAGRRDDEVVLVARSQSRDRVSLTAAELRDAVARARAGLQRLGLGPGDRVAAYLPNTPEAVVGLLATASLGAIWSSCAPEFGTRSVVDRWSQIEPKVLLTIDGYRYGDREVDRTDEVAAIRTALPSLETTVVLPYLRTDASRIPDALSWAELTARPGDLSFEQVPFDHPLFVLYSSGTTGLPKPIVHGHGGILLEHLKIHALHHDLGPADRFFWFSTTGWMMWNYLVSGLAVDATIVLYDGSPGHPDLGALWRLAAEEGVTYFGTSAPFLMACRKSGLRPHASPISRGFEESARPARRCRRRDSDTSTRRSVHRSISSRSPAAPTCAPRSSGPRRWCRSGRASCRAATWGAPSRRTRPTAIRSSANRASSSSPRRCRPCRSRSGTTPTARAIAPPTSRTSPASGATGTGSRSPSAGHA